MIAAIKPSGANTRGLLAYLYGPGRHDEHTDPHIVAGFAMLAMPDPGRDENATLTQLARYLDEPVRLRNSEFGKKITDHVRHCPVRTAPEDRHLSDTEWGEIAQRIVAAAGIAPEGAHLACRWIAIRHADNHIHILATTVREDGRRPKLHDSGIRVGDACRQIEKDYGLRRLKKGDRTGSRAPSQAEMHKAERLGWEQTSREWLQDRIRAAIPHARTAEELLAYLEADGIAVKARRGPSGDLLGLEAGQPEEHPTARRDQPATAWHQATEALDTFRTDLTHAQAHITALGELLEATAQNAPTHLRTELQAASRAFARAQRSQIGRTTLPPTPYATRPATSSTPPQAPTAAPSPPSSPLSCGPGSSPATGTRPRATPTRPTPPAKPSTTCRQLPSKPSHPRSSYSNSVNRGRKPAAPSPTTYAPPSPTRPTGSSPTPAGPPSPSSWPTPKPEATNPTSS